MLDSQSKAAEATRAKALSNCPECRAELAVLRVIPGRAGSEYWTMRCTRCGGIHLDIVKPSPAPRPGPPHASLNRLM